MGLVQILTNLNIVLGYGIVVAHLVKFFMVNLPTSRFKSMPPYKFSYLWLIILSIIDDISIDGETTMIPLSISAFIFLIV